MDAPLTDRIVLRPTDEITALPSYPSVSDLIEHGTDRGRCELLPASELPASAWYPQAVESTGGNSPPAWWSDDPIIRSRAAHLFRLRNAYYVPAFGVIFSSSGEVMRTSMAEAADVTPDLAALPHAERKGNETSLSLPSHVRTLDRIVVSMPWGAIFNYGHFLLDCLPTVASIAEISELNAWRFGFPPLKPWQRRHLELLGVDAPIELETAPFSYVEMVAAGTLSMDEGAELGARWGVAREDFERSVRQSERPELYQISDLIWTNCMAYFMHYPNINYRTLRDRQLARKMSSSLAFEKVYVSRRGNLKRTFLSEPQLEERLQQLGFAIITPEQHTVDEQIDIFGNADIIVGCAGAALANVIYCKEGTTVVEITPARMVQTEISVSGIWVRNICAIVGCRWRPYYCADIPSETPVLFAGTERLDRDFLFDLDIEDLLGYIEGLAS